MKVYIYGGGNGSRLYPFSQYNSKMLLRIFGTSIVEIQLHMLETAGLDKVGILFSKNNTKELDTIRNKFPKLHIELLKIIPEHTYAWGAIRESNNDDEILIVNSDIIFSKDWLTEIVGTGRKSDATFVACNSKSIGEGQEGQVVWYTYDTDENIKNYTLVYTPNHHMANEIGISKIKTKILESINITKFSEYQDFWYDYFVPQILSKYKAKVLTSKSHWRDVGTWDRYHKIHMDILEKKIVGVEYLLDDFIVFKNRVAIHKSSINNNAKYKKNCVVFKNASIGPNTTISNSIIGNNVVIGENCVINDSVILDNGNLNSNLTINGKIIDGCKQYDKRN